jgi:hypothetical protein
MKKFPTMVVTWLLFPGQFALNTKNQRLASDLIASLTWAYDYWEIQKEARWIYAIRARMEIVIRNPFLSKYKDPESLVTDFPETIVVNTILKAVTDKDIECLMENGWLTILGDMLT